MQYTVPDVVRRQADKCPIEQSCLDTGRCAERSPCRVVHATTKGTLFVVPTTADHCDYRVSFGELWICRCPVPSYLHEHYGF